MRVTLLIAALHMHDRHIGTQRWHQQQRRAIQRRLLAAERRVLARDIAAQERARRNIRRSYAGGQQREANAEIAVVLDRNGAGNALLRGASIAMAQAFADVSDPGRLDFRDAARADELIEEHIGDGADQGEVALLLAYHLKARRVGYERLQ